ncbi:hypothetical protein [Paracoccus aminophilus]|uniref:Uncharacterized protein n=1 Tax=Paracoccus aminophilus JCM 7686 TaxID=1367847 RepID=S5YRT1_PARAH|nr:hypothetical protein [Paracoccus aminophilus]AGT07956.1 hypothetical protein JCM7686_0847 [Paracoccus aminophilus JCM 7686]
MLRPVLIGLGAFIAAFLALYTLLRPEIDMLDPRAPSIWWAALLAGGVVAGLFWSDPRRPAKLWRVIGVAALLTLLAAGLLIVFLTSTVLLVQVIAIGFAVLGDILTGGAYGMADELQRDFRVNCPLLASDLAVALAISLVGLGIGLGLRQIRRIGP